VLWSLGNLMVCESSGKGLVVQGEDASPLVYSTYGKLHCYLNVVLSHVFIC
jgi:hypothetical protein